MKKIFFITTFIFVFGFAFLPNLSLSQGMMGNAITSSDGHTAREEAEGKAVWEKLQAKELKCENLTDENFSALGEYFMGQMAGSQHEAMNNMMIQMMSEEGEKQIHTAIGKRMSNCEPNAPIPQNMMNMMMGGGMMGSGSNPLALTTNNSNNPMMNFGFTPFGWIGGIFMILFWVLVIVGIVVLIKWLTNQNKSESKGGRSAIDILKERYAKSEIDRKEFEDKKKDLT